MSLPPDIEAALATEERETADRLTADQLAELVELRRQAAHDRHDRDTFLQQLVEAREWNERFKLNPHRNMWHELDAILAREPDAEPSADYQQARREGALEQRVEFADQLDDTATRWGDADPRAPELRDWAAALRVDHDAAVDDPEGWDTVKLEHVGGDSRPQVQTLIANLRDQYEGLSKLLAEVDSHWHLEDYVYRYYHGSFKVFHAQADTLQIVEALRALLPGEPLSAMFSAVIEAGTLKRFSYEDNKRWSEVTLPILQSLFHARHFLELAVRYSHRYRTAGPNLLPSGWASLLYLWDLR